MPIPNTETAREHIRNAHMMLKAFALHMDEMKKAGRLSDADEHALAGIGLDVSVRLMNATTEIERGNP